MDYTQLKELAPGTRLIKCKPACIGAECNTERVINIIEVNIYLLFCLMSCLAQYVFCGSRYHLRDVIVGKIYFLLVRIKIRHMEIQIIKRESTGSGQRCMC